MLVPFKNFSKDFPSTHFFFTKYPFFWLKKVKKNTKCQVPIFLDQKKNLSSTHFFELGFFHFFYVQKNGYLTDFFFGHFFFGSRKMGTWQIFFWSKKMGTWHFVIFFTFLSQKNGYLVKKKWVLGKSLLKFLKGTNITCQFHKIGRIS